MEVARLFHYFTPNWKRTPLNPRSNYDVNKRNRKKEAWQEVQEITPAMSLNSMYLSFPTKMAPHFELTPRDFLPYRFFFLFNFFK